MRVADNSYLATISIHAQKQEGSMTVSESSANRSQFDYEDTIRRYESTFP